MGEWFHIRSKYNGLVLDVLNCDSSPGAVVSVWESNGGGNQTFRYDSSSKLIFCQMNGYCLDAVDGGNKIVLNPFGDSVSRWSIEAGCILETSTAKVLDIKGCLRDPGAPLILYPLKPTGSENQRWSWERA